MEQFPTQPGVYIHKDAHGHVIYVGKAKNLRTRIAYYFKGKDLDPKTELLIKNIAKTEYIVTNNELEALLLENKLIKKHKPKFNIELKENTRYAYIQVTKEEFPRVLVARKVNKKDEFFGPYTTSISGAIKMLRELFKIRSCKVMPARTCIYYDLNLCTGPCEGKISKTAYEASIKDATNLITRGSDPLIEKYKEEMKEAAKKLEFERAMDFKHRIELLSHFSQRQIVELSKQRMDQDVIGIASFRDKKVISILKIQKGVILKKLDFEFLDSEDLLNEFLKAYYSKNIPPNEIIVPSEFDEEIPKYLETIWNKPIKVTLPERGVKGELLDLARKNANAYFSQEDEILIEIKERLELDEVPYIIDFFDISNIGESVIVGSCVQFKNRAPNKSGYRLYNIQETFGQDDFRSMEEVIRRRYTTMPLPNLIMVDGGILQVNFALRALQELNLHCHVRGLAKREETIIFPVGKALKLNLQEQGAKLILRMRDAAHNFAIEHSRNRFKKHYKHSVLDDIAGIGESTKFKLLKHFGSLEKIQKASLEELEKAIGKARAKIVFEFFKTA